jgi:tRNA (mo5U34)-methyltransferase
VATTLSWFLANQESTRELRRRQNDFRAELAQNGWYHSFELPDGGVIEGIMSLAWQRARWSRFPIPSVLSGKRVLDIGPWDGWFSFEAERRGADVTSVDCYEVANYLYLHRRLGSKAVHRILNLYELPAAGLGRFHIVFCLGVLYHLKHPLLGLEIVCSLATEVAIVESFVTDGETWREHQNDLPVMEFYETDELTGQMDNWVGPSVSCVLAMCRTAGFARVELLGVDPANVSVACYRKWEPEPAEPRVGPPELLRVVNATTGGVNFYALRDEYISCWFRSAVESVTREDLHLEVGEFGAPAVFVRRSEDGLFHANFRLPPGTPQGWNQVRLRLHDSRFGNAMRIAVDMPAAAERITLRAVCDGASWQPGEVHEFASCWIAGLPENCDCANVLLWLGEWRLPVTFIGEPDANGYRQVNAVVPDDCARGELGLRVECGGAQSEAASVTVV